MDLDIRQYLTKAKEQKDTGALRAAYNLIRTAEWTNKTSIRHKVTPCFPPELYVVCAEEALQLGCLEICTQCLMMYFEGKPPANQFLCRAYLCQGQLKSPSTTGSVEDFEKAVLYFLKGIEISKDQPRYHFMVFNASVLYLQTVHPLLRPGMCRHLVPSLIQVVHALEEVSEPDHSWRAQLMMHLVECLVDSGKMSDACSFAKVTAEFIESLTPHLYPKIFNLLVRHKLCESDFLKMKEQSSIFAVIYKMQKLKNNMERRKQDEQKEEAAELKEIFSLLVDWTRGPAAAQSSSPHQSPTSIPPADRVAFLLELALLALQLKHQEIAADCLKELKSMGEATASQRIMMQCVQCELQLLKMGKMRVYSKANVEERLNEIGRLDQWLQNAVREGDPQAMQAVCATQWSACLPLLQRNLKENIKTALLRVARVLEDTQSVLLETRCQVHSELAVIEEEEGRFDAALTHLQKALMLDKKGTHRERLSSAVHLLQLRGTLCQTPTRAEDKAAMLMQQTKNSHPQDVRDGHPMLVNVGLLLAPDTFQMVLDADSTSKSSAVCGQMAELSAKAQLHSTSVQRVQGLLARQRDDTNDTERVKLWAALAKTARKQEVWDVCRAACRFCLLYDDGRWKIQKSEAGESWEEGVLQSSVRDLLRLLAEVCFINAEATIHKLRTEGMQLNSPAVPPEERGVRVSEDDEHWVVYRDWIEGLSAYTTSNFLRAAELGAEIGEPWVVNNAAVYLWNYNNHLLAAGEHRRLLLTLQRLVALLRQTGHTGERVLFVLLCDALARGLIQPLCGPDSGRTALTGDKVKKGAGKGVEKTGSVHSVQVDPAALQDIRKALELCDYALHLSNCNVPGKHIPIAVRKQVVATWVRIKRLLQQQIGPKMDVDDECKNEPVSAMTRVLVGIEMVQCNSNPRHMEFPVQSLSTLVRMAADCSWSDAVVEMQVWSQLAAFCHHAKDHSLALSCSHRALKLEDAVAHRLKTMPYALYDSSTVNEMLSSASCYRGLSMVHESNGDPHSYREALGVLVSSVSYAEKARNPGLCMAVARHYWNSCLPLTETPAERQQLHEPLEKILSALACSSAKNTNKQGKVKGLAGLSTMSPGSSQPQPSSEDDLMLRAAIYSLLFHIHTDRADWKSALQVLDKAIRDMGRSRHRLLLFKRRVLMRARLGESVVIDMQRFRDEGELYCSYMWHRVALCTKDVIQQMACYQNSITSLSNAESQWQKVSFLLEFGEWLYSQNFPVADAQHQIQWAIDLLHIDTQQAEGEDTLKPKEGKLTELESTPREMESKDRGVIPVQCESLVGVLGVLFGPSLFKLREVMRLDNLVRAHTLLAIMADRTSPHHQLNLLRAYTFVLRIWQVSMATVHEVFNEMMKNQPAQAPPSTASKKDKNIEKDKGKDKKAKEAQPPAPTEEKPKQPFQDVVLPATPEEWAHFICPKEARQTFRTNSSPHCINTHSINKQTQSLFCLDLLAKELHSLSLTHLTLPIMHLAETIAHDLLDRRGLSDLYRLRIVRICCQLGMEMSSPYREKLLNLSRIQEQEQMRCRKTIALLRERDSLHMSFNEKSEVEHMGVRRQQSASVCAQDLWLDKAEVCLSMGLYQRARQLLAEAHLVATELRDQVAVARCLLSLAVLACEEQNHGQALALLEKAQDLCGDEEFWYQLTLTMVKATAGQRDQDTPTKVDQIIKQGCGALKLALERSPNRASQLSFLITSLETRGAVESIHAAGNGKPGEALSTQAVQKLMAACDTLRESASSFTRLGYREQAAEAHLEHAQALRILAKHTSGTEGKHRHMLDAFSQMQLAVSLQEHVVLNAQSLLPPAPKSPGLSLAAVRRLVRLRLSLAELSMAMLEQLCAEEKSLTLARDRKASVEMALEEFTRCTPDPHSVEQEWVRVGRMVGQVALGQLAAVSALSLNSVETRARCLTLMGKCLRLLAVQKCPLSSSALWDGYNQEEEEAGEVARSEWKPAPVGKEDLGGENGGERSRTEPRASVAKSAELQRRWRGAQQLLGQSSEMLAQAIALSLQHKLPCSILAEACLNMLECHGQFDPAATGQYLALLQSCHCVAMLTEVLSSACSDTSLSQLAALLNLHRSLLLSQEEAPSSLLRETEDSLSSLSKAYSHLTINPNHLSILGELPSNLKILLLQHSEDGSELYGAFYEKMKPTENNKGKAVQVTSTLTCSRVAKVSVSPRALLALQERARAFGQETRHTLLKEACRHADECGLRAPREHRVFTPKTYTEVQLESDFRGIVRDMEHYLHPILSNFDFSCFRSGPHCSPTDPPLSLSPSLRHLAPSISIPESTKPKEKEEKAGSDKGLAVSSPMELGECVVLLADRMLLKLPLEALSVLQEEGLSSVSRDFSLQFLYSRMHREEPEKVESDNKKETKDGKGAKRKEDQSKAIKVAPLNRVLPPNTFPVDTRNFKYIVDPYNEGKFEGSILMERMRTILETHCHFTALWEGFMGSQQTPSLPEVEQLLTTCSAFVYVGMEHFVANIPPAKLAALNLSEWRMALLFDLVQNSASVLCQSKPDMQKSAGLLTLERSLETAVLLSLSGVRCITLNQWHSSTQRSMHNMDTIMHNLLRVGLTSGQAIHALRKRDMLGSERHGNTTGSNDPASLSDSKGDESSDVHYNASLSPSTFNCIIYGLPNLIIT